jgi:FkbM family methyltransferase
MQEKIKKALFKKNDGIYVELGAHDGNTQSNTNWLEAEHGWKGILIEPSIDAFSKCSQARPNNFHFNCACVAFNYPSDTIRGDFSGHLMSSVSGARRAKDEIMTDVQARTLQSILDECNLGDIDFLSLDTEGYELEVLKGIDFSKQKIKQILIEITDEMYGKNDGDIYEFMESKNYSLAGCLSGFTKETHSGWSGDHNDYLFNLI